MVTANVEEPDGGIDLFAIIIAFLSEWRLGTISFIVALLIGTGVIFVLPREFVATAVLLPQEGRSESGSLASLFSDRGPGPLYLGLLQSRSVQNDVIARANLLPVFHLSSMDKARSVLNAKSKFSVGTDTLVTISVRDRDGQQAAKIADSYLEALQELNNSMAFQQSSQTTRFFEQQLDLERQQLVAAETVLAKTQKQTGLVAPDAQTQIGLNAIATTRAEITAREVELRGLLQGATEQNPQVQRLRSQIEQLQAQERHLEEGASGSPVGAAPPAGQMPQTNLDLARAQREVRYHDALVNSLANQFETARLNEAFARPVFQVVDRAVVPERKAWPPRKPYFAAAVVLAALIGLGAITAKLAWRRIARDPAHQEHLAQLRRIFGSR